MSTPAAVEDVLRKYKATILRKPEDDIREKFERMEKKYSWIHFKKGLSINEFNIRESNKVKIGLMKGVQNCKERYKEVEAQSLKAEDFWKKYLAKA